MDIHETWSVALKEGYRQRLLREMFRSQGVQYGIVDKNGSETLYGFYISSDIVWVIKYE